MSRTSFRDNMVEDAIAHAGRAEELLGEAGHLEMRDDHPTARITSVMEKAKIHAQLAETYSRLAAIEERR